MARLDVREAGAEPGGGGIAVLAAPPIELDLPRPLPTTLGAGAMMASTIASIDGRKATVSRPIGSLDIPDAVLAHRLTLEDWVRRLDPESIGCDLHPDFPSTHHAHALGLPVQRVQHHHAHAAAAAAECGWTAPFLAVVLDGFGLGDDGGAWGGELLRVDGTTFCRIGHFVPLAQPGGDGAANSPWRMAMAALYRIGRVDEAAMCLGARDGIGPIGQMIARGVNAPMTSSAGRLFDAACGLLQLEPKSGLAAAALEMLVTEPEILSGGWSVAADGTLNFDTLLDHLTDTRDRIYGANVFHGTLIAALTDWISATGDGTEAVALSGGCFHNKVLRNGLETGLRQRGHKVLGHRRLPPGDECISLGQAWIAALAVAEE